MQHEMSRRAPHYAGGTVLRARGAALSNRFGSFRACQWSQLFGLSVLFVFLRLVSGGHMRRLLIPHFTLAACLAFAVALAAASAQDPDPKLENKGTPATVMGYVRDVSCLMRHPDVLKPNNDCAVMCAKAGAPLVIAAKDGALYTPISTAIPDSSQRARLMPLVGKYVRVRGRIFDRSGMKAIAIEAIEPAADTQ
jgi:hypothetical protein